MYCQYLYSQCHRHTQTRTYTSIHTQWDMKGRPQKPVWTSSCKSFRDVPVARDSRLHGTPKQDAQTDLLRLKACGQVEVPRINTLFS